MEPVSSQLPDFDYHAIMMEESPTFYSGLSTVDKTDFNRWVRENFMVLDVVNSFDEIVPKLEEYDKVTGMGITPSPSRCHFNSKAVGMIDSEYQCFTGFVWRSDPYDPIITHSFNFRNGKVVDFSRKENRDTIMMSKANFPHRYFGIQIPLDFIKAFQDEPSEHPLLHEWFVHTQT